jgi:hypothetical protein
LVKFTRRKESGAEKFTIDAARCPNLLPVQGFLKYLNLLFCDG